MQIPSGIIFFLPKGLLTFLGIALLINSFIFHTSEKDFILSLCLKNVFGEEHGINCTSTIQNSFAEGGARCRRVGSPSHLSPPNYLDNLQIILKIYEFSLRFKERTAGTLQ